MSEIAVAKADCRAFLRARVAAVSPAMRVQQSRLICDRVKALDCYRKAMVVLLYRPLPSEVDVSDLWEDCRAVDRTVFAPRVEAATRRLRFIRVTDRTTWRRSDLGIWEPEAGDDFSAELAAEAVIIVPALGISPTGERIGRGKGFYDRALSTPPIGGHGYRIGVVFDEQVVEPIPVESFDVPMHAVISASRGWVDRLPLGSRP